MDNELLYQVALTMVPNIGDVHTKLLIRAYGSAEAVFRAPRRQLEHLEGIGAIRAQSIKQFNGFGTCGDEIAFLEKYKVEPLFFTSDNYPQRLLNCYDSPALLFYRGNADLNSNKVISIVGTRNNTDYGKKCCEKLIEALQDQGVLVVSGLAFGIDTIAHRSALKYGLSTIGVMAHGLDRIYPPQNRSLARQMTENGGLLTDFRSNSKPDKQNFPKRNRIVAGMCDALIVIESAKRGGSLITAEIANSYNKDVFAFPGRATDLNSEGCNYLVKSNKASLITCADDLLELMNWNEQKKIPDTIQRELFVTLSGPEKAITEILQKRGQCSIDELYLASGLSSSEAAEALLMLEMQGIICNLPGKLYRLA